MTSRRIVSFSTTRNLPRRSEPIHKGSFSYFGADERVADLPSVEPKGVLLIILMLLQGVQQCFFLLSLFFVKNATLKVAKRMSHNKCINLRSKLIPWY
jgi:hypothetical protein